MRTSSRQNPKFLSDLEIYEQVSVVEVDEAGEPGEGGRSSHFLPGSKREGVLASQVHTDAESVVVIRGRGKLQPSLDFFFLMLFCLYI